MISVALCTYNGEQYINEQLESIVNQTILVDEIVVCDDGSTDNTIQVVQTFATQHQNISFKIIINNINIGVRRNFEKALKLCEGEIKFLSDQDDIWMPNKAETVIEYFRKNPDKNIVMTNAVLIDENNKILTDKTLFDCVGLTKKILSEATNDNIVDLFLNSNRATGATMAIRKNVNLITNYNTPILHDYILAIEALSHNSLGIIIQPLIQYRIHKKQERGIGDEIGNPLNDNIYELKYEYFGDYPLPRIFLNKITMRDKRYKWMSGLRGVLSIIYNWRLYKKTYPTLWMSYIKTDINHTIGLYKNRQSQKKCKQINTKKG
ncbi:MAG: glycosyltransferase [Bacteroidales bacterium]|nr:glycosyltransferase [Bacteroidales bacterium]